MCKSTEGELCTISPSERSKKIAKVLGKNLTTTENGIRHTTLQLAEDFPAYYSNAAAGRTCSGKRVSSVYIGDYDSTDIQVGSEIEILYDRAITTKSGTYQPIKMINILK